MIDLSFAYDITKEDFYQNEKFDNELVPICNALNSLPGIRTTECCSGHNIHKPLIFFRVTNPAGIFFLTRCKDRRYWKYGHKWNIELQVGDTYENELPTEYLLTPISKNTKGEKAVKQLNDLVNNMEYHLNHKNFMTGFNLDVSTFITKQK